ncbi:MAG: hypothetical protein H6739_27745 [Alphaproteobacteria bacterium]|nr:hypothetical protein [Alphaproteobacteria bacterium]
MIWQLPNGLEPRWSSDERAGATLATAAATGRATRVAGGAVAGMALVMSTLHLALGDQTSAVAWAPALVGGLLVGWLRPDGFGITRNVARAALCLLPLASALGATLAAAHIPVRFSFLYLVPSLTLPFPFPRWRRALLTVAVTAAATVAWLLTAPETLQDPLFLSRLSFLVACALVAHILGEGISFLWTHQEVNRLRLEEARDALDQLNRSLTARVRKQRSELQALAFHLSTVGEGERTRIRRSVQRQLRPELAAMRRSVTAALDAPDSAGEPREELLDCDICVQRVHEVFRDLLGTVHPQATNQLGLKGALRLLARDVESTRGQIVQLHLPETLPILPPDRAEAVVSVARDALLHADERGCSGTRVLTLEAWSAGLHLILSLGRPTVASPDVSVTAVGLRERVLAMGGRARFEEVSGSLRAEVTLPYQGELGVTSPSDPDASDPELVHTTFEAFLHGIMVHNMQPLAVALLLTAVLWWPLDFVLYDDPRIHAGMAGFRAIAVLASSFLGLWPPGRRLVAAHPVPTGVSGMLVMFGVTGLCVGSFGTVEEGWVHHLLIAANLNVAVLVALRARILVTALLVGVSMGGFFLMAPEQLASPAMAELGIFTALSVVIQVIAGHACYLLLRSVHARSLEVEESRQELIRRRRWLAQTVDAQTAELRTCAQELQEAQIQERRWLAEALHDEVGQIIATLRYTLAYARRVHARAADRARDSLRQTLGLLDGLEATLERLLARLQPSLLLSDNLTESLPLLLRAFAPTGSIRTSLEVDPALDALPPRYLKFTYRVVQEGLTNVLKHAHAQSVAVKVHAPDTSILIEVRDDGRGMQMPGTGAIGLGLAGLSRGAAALGGRVNILTDDDGGTVLVARIPIPAAVRTTA